MGSVMDGDDARVDGVPVSLDHAGEGGYRAVIYRRVSPDAWPVAPGAFRVMPPAAPAGEAPLVLPERGMGRDDCGSVRSEEHTSELQSQHF
jgi:hypothetical protein